MKTRPAYVADRFYPGDPVELRSMVETFIAEAPVATSPDMVSGMVVPHAGFIFSGATAGFGYKRIQGGAPTRIVLLGASHRYRFDGLALFDGDAFDCPLGRLTVDRVFADALGDLFGNEGPRPHEYEHTLETQLPFLLCAVGNRPIVPVLFGSHASEEHVTFGKRLADMLAPEDLVIASTDLSHFLSEQEANAIDRRTIEAVVAGDANALIGGLREDTCSMCGGAAVVAAMACASARGATNRHVLDYRTSGAVSGDYGRVVGYTTITLEYNKETS